MINCTSATSLHAQPSPSAVGLADDGDDWCLLRPSMYTEVYHSGVQEVKSAYDNGNDTVRHMLMNECNIIYECNACRNLFRRLTTFLTHKHKFCFDSSSNYSDRYKELEKDKNNPKGNINSSSDQVEDCFPTNSNSGPKSVRDEHEVKPEQHLGSGEESVQCLAQVAASPSAVQQIVKQYETQVKGDEISNLPSSVADAQADATNNTDEPFDKQFLDLINSTSQITLQTNKPNQMLTQRQEDHPQSMYAYQCPLCSLTFLQSAAILRHLSNEHKKSARRIRLMRDIILEHRIPVSEIHSKKPSRDLKRQHIEDSKDTKESNTENDNKTWICHSCENVFESNAALGVHLLNCRSKVDMTKSSTLPTKRARIEGTKNGTAEGAKLDSALESIIGNSHSATELINRSLESEVDLNEAFENLNKTSFESGLRTISIDNLDMMEEDEEGEDDDNENDNNTNPSSIGDDKECTSPSPSDEKANEVSKSKDDKLTGSQETKPLLCRCKLCDKIFDALSNARRHLSMYHYRSRKFGCTLCDYRAFRRYDIANHLNFAHKMTGDREKLSVDYVSVHEVNYTKDDMDADIIVLTEEETKVFGEQNGKRKKRTKPLISSELKENNASASSPGPACGEEGRSTRQKLKRSQSHQSPLPVEVVGTGKLSQKRPIRNRIKPVNNDFVYDLSRLLAAGQSALKRRNTVSNESEIIFWYKDSIIEGQAAHIKGAVQRIALTLVGQGLAKSSTAPELPLERPVMRQNLTSTQRVDMQAGPVIETSELEAARLKATLLDDSFLENIAMQSNAGFKLKPCLQLPPHRTLDSLLERFDNSLHGVKTMQDPQHNVKLELNGTTIELESMIERNDSTANKLAGTFVEPIASIPNASSPPPAPMKRITLMERLAENKTKMRQVNSDMDSLLRSALQN